jgi:hypothetical protein
MAPAQRGPPASPTGTCRSQPCRRVPPRFVANQKDAQRSGSRFLFGILPTTMLGRGMLRSGVFLALAVLIPSEGTPAPASPAVMSVCEISTDFPSFRDKPVAVRGVYYYGLRQECSQKCAGGLWPSFINLAGGADATWAALSKAEHTVETEAKTTGKRFEIWVTVIGRLQTRARHSPLGPCDRKSWGLTGYGHLGAYPAQIDVDSFRHIEVKVNPQSPYDYSNMYHGPA